MSKIPRNATWLAALVIFTLGCAVGTGLAQQAARSVGPEAVSYTHLTLPTILRV